MLNENAIVEVLNKNASPRNRYGDAIKSTEGMKFGVELEIEGRGVSMEGVPARNWRRVADGSLRGESIEYVFATPCDFKEANGRVDKLFKAFKDNDVALKNSYRCSTHVHLNFSDKTTKQVVLFFFLHTILEEMLENYCGDQRAGNLFCLSSRSTEALVEMLDEAIFERGDMARFNDEVRYCAANLASLNKFGTIEIRTMRGADNADMVKDWLDILNSLYEFACRYDRTPARLIESLSHLGPDGFLRQFFSEAQLEKLMASWPAIKDVPSSLMEGVRLLQMLAYKLDDLWDREYVAPEVPKAKARPLGGGYDPNGPPEDRAFARVLNEMRGRGQITIDYIELPGHGAWAVPLANETADRTPLIGGGYYDADSACYFNADGEPIRWMTFNGRIVYYESARDRDINWRFHEYYGNFEDEDNEEELEEDDGY